MPLEAQALVVCGIEKQVRKSLKAGYNNEPDLHSCQPGVAPTHWFSKLEENHTRNVQLELWNIGQKDLPPFKQLIT